MLAPFFSYFVGYTLTAMVITLAYPWQIVFYFQAALLIPSMILTMFTPMKYFDIDQAMELKRKQDE